jgi:hypothetical protein
LDAPDGTHRTERGSVSNPQEIVFAHEPRDPLSIHDHSALSQLGGHPPVPIPPVMLQDKILNG